MTITLDTSYPEIIAEMERIRILFKLKTTLRYQSSRDGSSYSESVAEHLYGMNIIANYFLPLEDPNGTLDRTRIHELFLFHEIGEIETGDISFHQKTDDHRQMERLAVQRVGEKLPESMRAIALERSREFDDGITPEAKFAQAIDKIEPIFEMFDESVLPLFKIQKISREFAVGYKFAATEHFPYMHRFVEAWEDRAVSLGAF